MTLKQLANEVVIDCPLVRVYSYNPTGKDEYCLCLEVDSDCGDLGCDLCKLTAEEKRFCDYSVLWMGVEVLPDGVPFLRIEVEEAK